MSSPGLLLAGRYRLERRIAAGGVGEVWRAEDLVLARPVAVKLLQPGYASHPQTLARFRAEARHAGSLTHPAIAQVYDYGETGPAGAPYLVLELVDGPSLAGSLASGPLDSVAAMDVVAQVAAGLAAAHAAGLVHRDVKPANLLMGRDGPVKITDFGIAHAAGSAPITQVGTLVGTPAYLAPERAAGKPATPASDMYSLGIVAFECLTGMLPYHGHPDGDRGANRLQPLPPLPPAVPAAVAALVTDLTTKDPADRPGSAAEVAARATRLRDTLDAGTSQPGPRHPGTAGRPPDGRVRTRTRPSCPIRRLRRPRCWTGRRRTGVRAPRPPGPGRPAGPGPPGSPGWPPCVVALAAWLLASAGSGPPSPAARPPQASPAASTQGPATVTVNAAALVGHPVGAVRLRLARLGLRSQVVRSAAGEQRPGVVVSVQPTGLVTPGTVITVTAAAARPGHRHHQAKHHGDGNGGPGRAGTDSAFHNGHADLIREMVASWPRTLTARSGPTRNAQFLLVGRVVLALHVRRDPSPVADHEALRLGPVPDAGAVLAGAGRPAACAGNPPDLPGVRDEPLGDLVQAPAVLHAQIDLERLPVEADRPGPRLLRASTKVASHRDSSLCHHFPTPEAPLPLRVRIHGSAIHPRQGLAQGGDSERFRRLPGSPAHRSPPSSPAPGTRPTPPG